MSAWFLATDMEEREGGSLHFTMGPEMGSDGQVTGWDPPRRIVYEEDWAALMGKDPDALSPLTSQFLVEAQSGGTCVVHVTSSGFGTGAAWESEFWDDMGSNWMPCFDNLRLYLSHFPGQEATHLEVTASHPGCPGCSASSRTARATARRRRAYGRTCSPPTLRTTCGVRSRPGRPGCRGSLSRPGLLRGTTVATGAPTTPTDDAGP